MKVGLVSARIAQAGRHVVPQKTLGPFTGKQLTVIICTLMVVLLFPVGAWAVSGSNVFVTDPWSGGHGRIEDHLSGQAPQRARAAVVAERRHDHLRRRRLQRVLQRF